MRYAKTRPQAQFLNTVAVFLGEVVKLIASLVLFFISTKSFKESFSALYKHFVTDFLDTIKVGVPAFIYTIQNFLLFVAIENLDAGTYMVTYQLKILTTAFFTVLMMKRRLSVAQWLALMILVAGVAIVQYSAKNDKAVADLTNSTLNSTPFPDLVNTTQMALAPAKVHEKESPIFGLFCVIVACFLSGFAGIYFEKVLKGSNVSVWLRNVQLASLSIPIGLGVIFIRDREKVFADGFMQGFDWVVWSVVLLQALGGLVVAVVIKYADNILKGFATSIAIVVSCVASIFIFGLFPKLLFIAGTALVIGAVVIYSVFPYKKKPASLVPKKVAKDVADNQTGQKVRAKQKGPTK